MTSARALTLVVLLGGHVERHELHLQLAVSLALGQPAPGREVPLPAERRAVDLDAIEVPVAAQARVVVFHPANKRAHRKQ